MLRSRGYNVTPREAYTFTLNQGTKYHDGTQFQGVDAMVDMLHNEAGLNASKVAIGGDQAQAGWANVDKELAEGRPVLISSPGHYWAVSAKDPTTGNYYVGATALSGQKQFGGWLPKWAFQYGGDATHAITAQGEVNPNSRAVTQMKIAPPQGVGSSTRGFLTSTPESQARPAPAQAPSVERPAEMPRSYAREIETKAYQAAVRAGHPDPIEFVEQMRHESGDFDPNVLSGQRRSSAGAVGVAQIMPGIAAAAKVDPLNQDQALDYAAKRMATNYKTYNGDSERALAEYNMGAGNLQKYGPRGLPETNKYIDLIHGAKGRVQVAAAPGQRGDPGMALAERAGGTYNYAGSAPPEAPSWIQESNADSGTTIGEGRVRDTAARLWNNSYQMSNGDSVFADVIGGIANGEAGFAGIKDNRGATGIFQMDPAGGWQQLDRYLKDNNIPMSRDQAAKNVDIMSDFYVSRLYKSYQRAKAAGIRDPEDLAVNTVIYQWDPKGEPGAAHNAGIDGIPSLEKNYREGYREFKRGVFRMVPRSEWAGS
jgi:soluble lytic murein transglycosylase-like protein